MTGHHRKHFSILENTSTTVINVLTSILYIQSSSFKILLICNLAPGKLFF